MLASIARTLWRNASMSAGWLLTRGQRGDLAFDQLARVEQLERSGTLVAPPRLARRRGRAATKMPVPTRTSTSPPISSEMIASRTDVRLTPSDAASSRSAGSRDPGGNSPLAISCAI